MAKRLKLVAEICLYGNRATGAGWLARLADGTLLGDGEPVADQSNTEAVWKACDAVRERLSGKNGVVVVFAPGGQQMAVATLGNVGYYGDLKWEPARQYAVSFADVVLSAK